MNIYEFNFSANKLLAKSYSLQGCTTDFAKLPQLKLLQKKSIYLARSDWEPNEHACKGSCVWVTALPKSWLANCFCILLTQNVVRFFLWNGWNAAAQLTFDYKSTELSFSRIWYPIGHSRRFGSLDHSNPSKWFIWNLLIEVVVTVSNFHLS